MASKKKPMHWQGHPVRDEQHANDLHLKAAVYEFHHGMDRAKAEERVKHEDRVERHQKAAAHHLDGMRAANAIGNHEDAQRHHGMYSLHVKALGHDPSGAVHPDIGRHREGDERSHAYNFKGHDDDQFLVQPVRKSEDENVPPATTPKFDGGHKQLLDYLKSRGVHGAKVEAPPMERKPPLKVYEGGGYGSAPKFGHLRVVKAEDAQWLRGAHLGKADPARVKRFDAKRSHLQNRHLPEEKGFDYTSNLTPEQQKAGYKMFVLSHGNGNPVRVHVMQQTPTAYVKVGGASGNVDQRDLEVESYHLAHPAHHNKGIEASMLNTLMGHAKQHMGAKHLSHAPFTPEASAFIEAVAKPHGYELGDFEDIEGDERPVDQPAGRLEHGGVKARSKQEGRVPRSFSPRINHFWMGD